MTFFELLDQETAGFRSKILLVAAISGLAHASLFAIIVSATQSPSAGMQSFRFLLMFAIAFLLYALCFRRTCHQVTVTIEAILKRLRVRVADKIRHAELLHLEHIDRGEIFNLLTTETGVISESSSILATALQAAILLACAVIYLALFSLPAFLLCLVFIGGGIRLYLHRLQGMSAWIQQTSQQEIHCFNIIRDLLDGFKELKLNENRSRDLMEHLTEVTETLRSMKIKTADLFSVNSLVAYGSFYVAIAAVIFLLPKIVAISKEDMIRAAMTVLFVLGPLATLVGGVQALSKCNVAVHNIALLEQRLDRATRGRRDGAVAVLPLPPDFTEIQLQGVSFQYIDEDGSESFRVGPLDLAIKKGEILFVMGGNGSGKTTLLKLLTTLYPLAAGRLVVDNHHIGQARLPSYRGLFAAVFADFHLFAKLYGMYNIPGETVQKLLTQFHLEQKTAFATDHFTNIQLSSGQRKRLAMIVALLEDRPVYIFDEWAADQDPEFRQYFYEQLLPDLVARGKTVIAVMHDERYLHVAHRIVKMELGHIESVISPS
jgi:putative ATP-binding cassette transporter